MTAKIVKKQLKIHSRRSRSSSRQAKISRKHWETTARRIKSLSVVAGFLVSLVIVFNFIHIGFTQSGPVLPMQNAVVVSKQDQKIPAVPVRLLIPKIKVDALIESVGLTAKGAVGAPKGPSKVAWYNLSARPGNIGSAVFTGHYGPWIGGRRSVFDNLYKLKKGDKIYIKDDKGVMITFIVRELKSYDKNAKVTEAFVLNDDKSHLNLITCDGVWNRFIRQYSKRLVVFADKE